MTEMVHNYLVYVVWFLVPIFKWFHMNLMLDDDKTSLNV